MIFNFLPILFLLIAIFVIMVMNRIDAQVGVSWLVLAIGTGLAAGSILILRWIDPPMVEISRWLAINDIPVVLRYGFDRLSWAFAFTLSLLLIGVVFTIPVRLDVAFRPRDWIFDLLFILFGLFPIMAQNLMSLVIAWTLLDVLELVIHISGLTPQRINRQAVLAFAIRVGGSWLLILAQVLSRQGFQAEVAWQDFDATSALLLLLAGALRLGIFPVLLPFQDEAPIRHELGTIMRFVVPASSFVLLTRLSGLVIPSGWAILLSILSLLASLFGVLLFLFSESSLQGRNFWIIALSGMVVASVVRGQADAALTWSITLILSGTFLSVHSEKYGLHLFMMIAMFLSLTGIPFTPTAAGMSGLIVLPFTILDIVFIIVFAILLVGFLRQQIKPETGFNETAGWMQVMYWFGVGILVIGFWFVAAPSIQSSINSIVWWGGIPALILALASFYGIYRFVGAEQELLPADSQLAQHLRGESLIYRFVERVFYSMRSLIQFITNLVEGDAAILWILLVFLMLMTMILQRGEVL